MWAPIARIQETAAHQALSMLDRPPVLGGQLVDRDRGGGPVFYAKLKLPDGTQPRRRLGHVWTKRSRPPDGYLTRAQAEARLQAILEGDDPLVNLSPSRVTFKAACEERLRYLEMTSAASARRSPTTAT